MSQKLSAKVLQDMLDEDYRKEAHQFESIYQNERPGMSPND